MSGHEVQPDLQGGGKRKSLSLTSDTSTDSQDFERAPLTTVDETKEEYVAITPIRSTAEFSGLKGGGEKKEHCCDDSHSHGHSHGHSRANIFTKGKSRFFSRGTVLKPKHSQTQGPRSFEEGMGFGIQTQAKDDKHKSFCRRNQLAVHGVTLFVLLVLVGLSLEYTGGADNHEASIYLFYIASCLAMIPLFKMVVYTLLVIVSRLLSVNQWYSFYLMKVSPPLTRALSMTYIFCGLVYIHVSPTLIDETNFLKLSIHDSHNEDETSDGDLWLFVIYRLFLLALLVFWLLFVKSVILQVCAVYHFQSYPDYFAVLCKITDYISKMLHSESQSIFNVTLIEFIQGIEFKKRESTSGFFPPSSKKLEEFRLQLTGEEDEEEDFDAANTSDHSFVLWRAKTRGVKAYTLDERNICEAAKRIMERVSERVSEMDRRVPHNVTYRESITNKVKNEWKHLTRGRVLIGTGGRSAHASRSVSIPNSVANKAQVMLRGPNDVISFEDLVRVFGRKKAVKVRGLLGSMLHTSSRASQSHQRSVRMSQSLSIMPRFGDATEEDDHSMARCNCDLPKKEFRKILENYLKQFIRLKQTFDSYNDILQTVNHLSIPVIILILIFIALLLFNFDFETSLSVYLSILVVIVLLFKEVFMSNINAFVLLFVIQPYNVGDVITFTDPPNELDSKSRNGASPERVMFRVKEIRLMATIFVNVYTKEVLSVRNDILYGGANGIVNVTRTHVSVHSFTIYVAYSICNHTIRDVYKHFGEAIDRKFTHHEVCDTRMHLESLNPFGKLSVKFSVYVNYSFANVELKWKHYNELLFLLRGVLKDLKVEYFQPPQKVHVFGEQRVM